MRDEMVSWNNLVADRRVDAIAATVQRVCLLVVITVELLFFLPGEAADGLVYLFLEWKLVDISILFLAASFCRKYLRQSKWFFLLGLVIVVWFYVLRGVHLRLEGVNQDPGAFVCAYLLCLSFASASGDRQWGLKGPDGGVHADRRGLWALRGAAGDAASSRFSGGLRFLGRSPVRHHGASQYLRHRSHGQHRSDHGVLPERAEA